MAFPAEFLERLRQLVPLEDVVGRRVRLQRNGREFKGLCPFHNEKTPSFHVVADKNFYHCFGCGAHGDAISFVMETEGLSFPEAVERLAGEAGLEVPKASPEEREREARRASLHDCLEAACLWFEEQLKGSGGIAARRYLAERGLSEETIVQFRLGYAPDRRGSLRKALNARGIGDDLLVAGGLLKRPEGGGQLRDYFFDRVIFPITDRQGRVIAFGGRTMGDSPAKYLNSPDTDLFHKGRVLYNLARARRAAQDRGEVVVCEGYMDVIALSQAGFPAAVAPLGTAVTEDQIRELWRLAPEPTLCLDGDEAGHRAGLRVVERALPGLKPGYSLRFASLPLGEDPDSLVRAQGAGAFRQVLERARPLADLLWERETLGRPADTPERRTGIQADLQRAVAQIADPAVQKAYREEMQRRFDEALAPRRQGGEAGYGSGRYGSAGGKGFKGRGFKGRRSGGRFDDGLPQIVTTKPRAGETLRRRQEQVLLACAINHPELLVEDAELLAELVMVGAETASLRQSLLDYAAAGERLDSESIRRHLRVYGFDREVDQVCARAIYIHGGFARPDASIEEAREGWQQLLTILLERGRDVATAEGTRALADRMDADALTRLEANKKATYETENRVVTLDHLMTPGRPNVK